MIYFDNAATTRVCPEAARAAMESMCEDFGNPSSLHMLGFTAEKRVREARRTIADALGADEREITFTSCGSESNNLVLFGLSARSGKKRHLITTEFEHPSVLNTCKALEAKGYEVTYIAPRDDGSVHAEDVAAEVREDTFLVSVMSVNNETGAIQNIAEITRAVRAKNRDALIHTDAVQAFMKIPISAKKYGADLISVSGHKIGAPKGIGALYIKNGVRLTPQILGGGQEKGLRSGTEPTAQIAAFARSVALAQKTFDDDTAHMRKLLEALKSGLSSLPNASVFTAEHSAPHILTVAFSKYPSEVIMRILEENEIYVSAGSACSKGKKSHVLRAVKVPEKLIGSSVRISLSRFSTEAEVSEFLKYAEEKLV